MTDTKAGSAPFIDVGAPPPLNRSRTPFLQRFSKAWNHVMGMVASTGLVAALLAVLGIGVIWLYRQVM